MIEGRKFDFPKGSIIAFDKGYVDYHWLRLRRIGYRDATTGKFYEFLTNNFQLAASTIAAIYKDRWQVELFFKAIKKT